jgi:hypothetical protein
VRFAVNGEETEGKNSGADIFGKIQANEAGERVKSWF